MRNASGGVCLVHELGQLRRAEEFLDGSHHGANVHQGLRRDFACFLGVHALASIALHAGQANAELVLDQLAHRTNAAVTEMVDIIGGNAFCALVQCHDVLHGLHDVLFGQRGGIELGVKAQLLIDLVAADFCQVIALRAEEQTFQRCTCGVNGRRLAGTIALVQLDERFFLRGGGVAVKRAQHHFVGAQQLDDFVARFSNTQRAQQQRCRLLALAVDTHGKHVALVRFKFQPSTAARNNFSVVDKLVGRLVALGREVHARAAHQLGNNNTLGAVDDEGAATSHLREIAHKDVLLFDFARLKVDEAHVHEQRSLIGNVLLLAFVNAVLRFAKVMCAKFNAKSLSIVLDGSHVSKSLLNAFRLEPLKALRLDCDQIRDIHNVGNLRKASAGSIIPGHSAFSFLVSAGFPTP